MGTDEHAIYKRGVEEDLYTFTNTRKNTVLRRGNILHGETVLLIPLVYMAHTIPLYHMSDKFGGDPREFFFFC